MMSKGPARNLCQTLIIRIRKFPLVEAAVAKSTSDPIFPPVPGSFVMPFYYASLSLFAVFYCAETNVLESFLEGTGLKVAKFKTSARGATDEDHGYASVEFQNYTGLGGTLLETCNEVELNVHAYPASQEHMVPTITFLDYLAGQEQTKTIGALRVDVPADNAFAVKAGADIFGEQKFLTSFRYSIPSLNTPGVKTWNYSVFDPKYKLPSDPSKDKPTPKDIIYTVNADMTKLESTPGTPSPITLYALVNLTDPCREKPPAPPCLDRRRKCYGPNDKLNASRWEIRGEFQTYLPSEKQAGCVRLSYGKSGDRMRQDMERLLGKSPTPAAVRIFQSVPPAAENRPFYVEM